MMNIESLKSTVEKFINTFNIKSIKNWDKLFHFVVGVIIGVFFTVLHMPNIITILAALIVATSKEIYDFKHPNHVADFMDIFITLLGCLTILIIK